MTTRVKEVEGFKLTTAIRKLRKLTKRTKIVPGGTSAGKTFGILPILIDKAAKKKGLSISVVSESIPHLKKGAIKDFKKIMISTGRWAPERYNKTDQIYTFANGSYIEFFSADSEGKVRGPRRDILYINECNNIQFETYYQLQIRTAKEIWLDYNPSHEFWVHTELGADEDAETLILTYKDNEALPASIVREIEKNKVKAFYKPHLKDRQLFRERNIKNSYWANWWRVYGMGLVGSLEGVIFSNWGQVDQVPLDATLLGYGMDFGFSNHPTALVAVYRWNGKIILDELIYATELLNRDIINQLKELDVKRNLPIWADEAEPKSIQDIFGAGFRIDGASKKKGIKYGLDLMQTYDMLITKRSVNLIKELRGYVWATDKNGVKLQEPIDAFNHAIDAVRYFFTKELGSYKPTASAGAHDKTKSRNKQAKKNNIYSKFLE